jgi:hypothetical protein
MPFLQVMSNRASEVFSFDNIHKVSVTIRADSNLTNVLERLGIAQTDAECAAIDALPPAVHQAVLGVMRSALQPKGGGDRRQITFSWSPAYAHSVHIWEARAVAGSPAAITVHLEGPYPGDA